MAIIRLQSEAERRKGIFYEFNSSEKPLGEGGMGKVYKGRCVDERTGLSKDVAIKFMYSDLPGHVIERARREASIQLRNDNLVEMLGFIEIEERGPLGQINMRYHVVSELLQGVMLDDLLKGKTTDQEGNQISFAQKLYKDYLNDSYRFAIYMIRNVLAGVMALHDAGYIHRDIDPTNIMITQDGHIKLIDFGIAKRLLSLNTHDKALTSAGQFMGKALYAAPELVLGDVKHQNQTTDIYAIGILLFQFLVGHLPFEGATHEVLNMQLHKKLPLKHIRQKEIRNVIATATNKKQNQRYQSASEFRVAVERLTVISYPGRESSMWKGITAAASVVIIAVSVWLFWPDGGVKTSGTIPPGTVIPPVDPPVDPPITPSVSDINYANAITLLRTPATAREGLDMLYSLSNNNDPDATFLLSRLYFISKSSNDYIPDSIKQMQKTLGIVCDFNKAHDYLKKTVSINSNDYKALYELGCDYLGGEARTNAVKRNIVEADNYLKKALEHARENNDSYYIKSIQEQMSKYNRGLK